MRASVFALVLFLFIAANNLAQWTAPQNLGGSINSSSAETDPSISTDGNTLYFASDRSGGQGGFDIWVTTKVGGSWQSPTNLGAVVNSYYSEFGPSISSDGKTLYFASDRPGGLGDNDLWMTTKIEGVWQLPVNVDPPVNTPYLEHTPSISADGDSLYFTSNRPGGKGDYDIWFSFRVGTVWQAPLSVSPSVNSTNIESNPTISFSENTLYFTSDRPGGLGRFDIWASTRGSGGWQSPVNLGSFINSTLSDSGCAITLNDSTLFFGSDRAGGFGGTDIWVTRILRDTPPSMEAISESQGHCYGTSPTFSPFGFYDESGLADGWYRIDSGTWMTLFTDYTGLSWKSDGWGISDTVFLSLAEGIHTLYFKASDDKGNVEGESGEWKWQFYKDTTPPGDPTDVTSPSHIPGEWSTNNVIELTWLDATDSPSECGVEGYSIDWDTTDSTVPDMIVDYPVGVQSATSPVLSDGRNHYVHMRTVDEAGNWQSTVHFGPFQIDTTPPDVIVSCALDTIRSQDDLCFPLEGTDNLTSEEELLFSYFRVGRDHMFSNFLFIDRICWEDLLQGGPYTLWVKARDLAGNIGPTDEYVFFFFPDCHTALKGDVNYDCAVNILDVLRAVNIILEISPGPTAHESWAVDCDGPPGSCDGNGIVNIFDAIKIVNLILGLDECP